MKKSVALTLLAIFFICIVITVYWYIYYLQHGFVLETEIVFLKIFLSRWWDPLFIPFFIVVLIKLFGYEKNNIDPACPSEMCFALGDGFFVVFGFYSFILFGGVNALILTTIVFASFYIVGFIFKFLDNIFEF